MRELQIKAESLAKRCDICHQSDQFNPESNTCLRCKDVGRFISYRLFNKNDKYLLSLINGVYFIGHCCSYGAALIIVLTVISGLLQGVMFFGLILHFTIEYFFKTGIFSYMLLTYTTIFCLDVLLAMMFVVYKSKKKSKKK